MYNAVPMQSTCATIAALLGIEAPADAYAPCKQVVNYVEKRLGKPERVIISGHGGLPGECME